MKTITLIITLLSITCLASEDLLKQLNKTVEANNKAYELEVIEKFFELFGDYNYRSNLIKIDPYAKSKDNFYFVAKMDIYKGNSKLKSDALTLEQKNIWNDFIENLFKGKSTDASSKLNVIEKNLSRDFKTIKIFYNMDKKFNLTTNLAQIHGSLGRGFSQYPAIFKLDLNYSNGQLNRYYLAGNIGHGLKGRSYAYASKKTVLALRFSDFDGCDFLGVHFANNKLTSKQLNYGRHEVVIYPESPKINMAEVEEGSIALKFIKANSKIIDKLVNIKVSIDLNKTLKVHKQILISEEYKKFLKKLTKNGTTDRICQSSYHKQFNKLAKKLNPTWEKEFNKNPKLRKTAK